MKTIITILFIFSASTYAIDPPVVYGEDNRVDANLHSNAMYRKLAISTAALVRNSNIEEISEYMVSLKSENLMKTKNRCTYEPFYKQPTASYCSGFLIANDIIVTAGHCVNEYNFKQFSWVFDYRVDYEDQSEVTVDQSKVYKIKRVISRKYESPTFENNLDIEDFAVVELERDVLDRAPLRYRESGTPSVGDELVVIGNPWKLPTKITDGGKIRSLENFIFLTDLDTYKGNSGSAVFNAKTGVVEGILINGETPDFEMNKDGCYISRVIPQDGGSGEGVFFITKVEGL